MIATSLAVAHDVVFSQIVAAARLFCFFDYDGTLAEIAATPDAAYPLDDVPELLGALAELRDVDIVIVSGRTLADLHTLLDVPHLYYVGTHGLEIQLPNGEITQAEGVGLVRSVLPTIRRQLTQTLAHCQGMLIEDKGAALAFHYRLATRSDAMCVRDAVIDIVREYRRRGCPIDTLDGHEVIEIRPLHVNKGKTVSSLFGHYGSGALPIYVGDDQTDEDAFRLLPAETITIRVGDTALSTVARYRIDQPHSVIAFLRELLDCRLQRQTSLSI